MLGVPVPSSDALTLYASRDRPPGLSISFLASTLRNLVTRSMNFSFTLGKSLMSVMHSIEVPMCCHAWGSFSIRCSDSSFEVIGGSKRLHILSISMMSTRGSSRTVIRSSRMLSRSTDCPRDLSPKESFRYCHATRPLLYVDARWVEIVGFVMDAMTYLRASASLAGLMVVTESGSSTSYRPSGLIHARKSSP